MISYVVLKSVKKQTKFDTCSQTKKTGFTGKRLLGEGEKGIRLIFKLPNDMVFSVAYLDPGCAQLVVGGCSCTKAEAGDLVLGVCLDVGQIRYG
jgi:hypothetical protein